MKIFAIKIVLLLLIVASLLTVVFQCPGTYTTELAVGINKIEMLQRKKSPRILFIGGSNLLTLKSRLIEKELNSSVMNLSFWYGLNYKNFIEVLKPYLKPCDTVVFVIEYFVYKTDMSAESSHESDQVLFLISPVSRMWYHIKNLDAINGVKILIELSQLKSKAGIKDIRTGKWHHLIERGLQDCNLRFNENGDFAITWRIKRPLDTYSIECPEDINRKFTFLNDFSDYAKKRNIKVFLSFPPYPIEYYRKHKTEINAIYNSLTRFLTFPILNKPEDYVLPEKYFCDTVYHADGEGAVIRTRKMAEALKVGLLK